MAISDALNVSAETLLTQAGLIDAVTGEGAAPGTPAAGSSADAGAGAAPLPPTEDAIRADERLTGEQRAALIAVYRSMLG
jgi:hypothetical protein